MQRIFRPQAAGAACAGLLLAAFAGAGPALAGGPAANEPQTSQQSETRLELPQMPTLRCSTAGGWHWSGLEPAAARRQAAGTCPGPVVGSHTNANFEGGSYVLQAGFSEGEVAAISFTLPAGQFPVRIDTVECIFAQQSTIEPTETHWSLLIWDGPPSAGNLVASFSSDNVVLPHLALPVGTHGANLLVAIDPSDPIFVNNESGTNTFSVGYRIDSHNAPPGNPCFFAPDPKRNAFPTTDTSGLAAPTGNWLNALPCPLCSGWNTFQDLSPLCRPSGDWVMRVTYTCTPSSEPGACCLNETQCLNDVSDTTCAELSGGFMGVGTTCATITCPEPSGGCCVNGVCLSDVEPSLCSAISGAYLGNFSSCEDNPCALGACCMPDGTCQQAFDSDCTSQDGVFQGIASDCGQVQCPQPAGACCINDFCIDAQPQEVCNAVGSWMGPFTACTPDPCASPPPVMLHGAIGVSFEDHAYGGYIDPRIEYDGEQWVGLQTITLVFSEAVRGAGGAELAPGHFVVSQTGAVPPPQVLSVDASENPVVRVMLDRPLTLQEWTTVRADVENLAGVAVENLGNLGSGVNEPDRVDIGFLPGDVDQDGVVAPLDALRWRQAQGGSWSPPGGVVADHIDTDRSGSITPVDFLRYRQLLFGTGSASQPWAGAAMSNPRP